MIELANIAAELTLHTCAVDDLEKYHRSGKEFFKMLNLTAQKYGVGKIDQHEKVLGFGCGGQGKIRCAESVHRPKNIFPREISIRL